MEIKEVFDYLGISGVDSLDKFKSSFEGKFITKANAHDDEEIAGKITANIYGGLTTEAKRLFGLKNEDVKDKPFKEIFKASVENLNKKIADMEGAANNDEKFNGLKKEFDTLKVKYDQTFEDAGKLRRELDEEKATSSNKIKQFQIGHAYDSERAKLPFADGTLDIAKVGFDTMFKQKYKLDLEDSGNILVTGADGKKVANPKRTGEYLNLSEVLDMELSAIPNLKKNNPMKGGEPLFKPAQQQNQQQQQNNNGVKIHPRAIQQYEKLSK